MRYYRLKKIANKYALIDNLACYVTLSVLSL